MGRLATWRGARVCTLGHSTRTLEELVETLRSFDVAVLADIRTVPRSRTNPQYKAWNEQTCYEGQSTSICSC
jgi:uncharacterized protein (DUF488 family)